MVLPPTLISLLREVQLNVYAHFTPRSGVVGRARTGARTGGDALSLTPNRWAGFASHSSAQLCVFDAQFLGVLEG